jgi:hypothetical protein
LLSLTLGALVEIGVAIDGVCALRSARSGLRVLIDVDGVGGDLVGLSVRWVLGISGGRVSLEVDVVEVVFAIVMASFRMKLVILIVLIVTTPIHFEIIK